jgi:hypothetical protein
MGSPRSDFAWSLTRSSRQQHVMAEQKSSDLGNRIKDQSEHTSLSRIAGTSAMDHDRREGTLPWALLEFRWLISMGP